MYDIIGMVSQNTNDGTESQRPATNSQNMFGTHAIMASQHF
jgi:hypothetical protein